MTAFLNSIFSILSYRPVYHLMIWSTLILIIYLSVGFNFGYQEALIYALIDVGIIAIGVYINMYILLKSFLETRAFGKYLLQVFLLILVFSPIYTLVFYWNLQRFESLHEVVTYADAMKQGILNSAAFIFISTILKLAKAWFSQKATTRELEKQNLTTELNFLKSQVNPHFLFNTLNNLYALTLQKSDTAPEVVLQLSDLLRYMLYDCNEQRVPLEKEVHYIKNYIALEKLRQGEHVNIDVQLPDETKDVHIAPLLFVPFLENAFKHGMNINNAFVKVQMELKEQQLFFRVDNSVGKKPNLPIDQKKKSGGIGLENVKRRLALMYPKKHNLRIKSGAEQHTVLLKIEL